MSLTACAELVRRGDPDRFLATMAAPPAARPVLFALYAFNVEVARAPWVTREPMIAEMRLQWWRDALDEIAAGGVVRRHEVVVPLAGVLDATGAGLLDTLIEMRRRDIAGPIHETPADLLDYLDATSGNLAWAAARALGAREGEASVRDVARAAGLGRYLVALPRLVVEGRARPLDETEIADLARNCLARWPAAQRVRALPRSARPALLDAWQARALLLRAQRQPERVASGRLARAEFARCLGLLGAALFGV